MPEHMVNGHFVMLPESTLRSKEWKCLKAYSRAVFTTMALKYDRKNGNGFVTWKQPELVEETGLPLRTVERGIQELKGKEFITVWQAGSRWGAGTTYKMSSLYMDGEHIER